MWPWPTQKDVWAQLARWCGRIRHPRRLSICETNIMRAFDRVSLRRFGAPLTVAAPTSQHDRDGSRQSRCATRDAEQTVHARQLPQNSTACTRECRYSALWRWPAKLAIGLLALRESVRVCRGIALQIGRASCRERA